VIILEKIEGNSVAEMAGRYFMAGRRRQKQAKAGKGKQSTNEAFYGMSAG
jgi:hypothetical protein